MAILTLFCDSPYFFTALRLLLKEKMVSFTCVLCSGIKDIDPILNLNLVQDGKIENDHVLLHKLVPGETVVKVLTKYHREHTKAVVLINIEDSHSLAPKYLENFKEYTFPVLIIKWSDGGKLLEIVKSVKECPCDISVCQFEPQDLSKEPGEEHSRGMKLWCFGNFSI